jgi:hypothetical protein
LLYSVNFRRIVLEGWEKSGLCGLGVWKRFFPKMFKYLVEHNPEYFTPLPVEPYLPAETIKTTGFRLWRRSYVQEFKDPEGRLRETCSVCFCVSCVFHGRYICPPHRRNKQRVSTKCTCYTTCARFYNCLDMCICFGCNYRRAIEKDAILRQKGFVNVLKILVGKSKDQNINTILRLVLNKNID